MGHPRGIAIIIKMKNAAPRKLSCTQPRASHEIMKGVVLLVFSLPPDCVPCERSRIRGVSIFGGGRRINFARNTRNKHIRTYGTEHYH